MKTSLPLFLILATSATAAIPAVGPDYVRPSAPMAPAFRGAGDEVNWTTAAPADALGRGEWWRLFADAALDDLERRALAANQDLRAAAARVEQARAAAGLARSAYWPQIAANGSVVRERTSGATDNPLPQLVSTTYTAPLQAQWELDLFGRVRRLSESARNDAAASQANFESVRLVLTADVASTFFTLRAVDEEQTLVRNTVELRRRALDLVSARQRSGSATDLDVARAETELASTEAESAALANRRAALQDALAVLVGEPASSFAAPIAATGVAASPSASSAIPPTVPIGLPSQLLERRPDIAAAERSLAAANARIGVAKAAFFPALSLTGSAGYASADVDRLFTTDARIWSIGPSLYLPIFQGGRNRANLQRSRATFDEAVAAYRGRVLIAFREVEDALAAVHFLADEAAAQDRALTGARRAAQLAQTRYDAGFVSYLDVIDAQRTALATERFVAQLRAQRLNAGVALIKALGGGWSETPLAANAIPSAQSPHT